LEFFGNLKLKFVEFFAYLKFYTFGSFEQMKIWHIWKFDTSENLTHLKIWHIWKYCTSENFACPRLFIIYIIFSTLKILHIWNFLHMQNFATSKKWRNFSVHKLLQRSVNIFHYIKNVFCTLNFTNFHASLTQKNSPTNRKITVNEVDWKQGNSNQNGPEKGGKN
jgi:hypothetical protein